MQVDGGIPAAGHGQQVTSNLARRSTAIACMDFDCRDSARPFYVAHLARRQDLNASCARRLAQLCVSLFPQINNRRNDNAAIGEFQCVSVAAIVVCKYHGRPTRPDAIAQAIVAGRRSQHHAGTVIVGEGDRPLNRTGSQNDLLRPHLPQALTHPVLVRAMLHNCQEILLVVARCTRFGQTNDLGHGLELRNGICDPAHGGCCVDFSAASQQRAARLKLVINQ